MTDKVSDIDLETAARFVWTEDQVTRHPKARENKTAARADGQTFHGTPGDPGYPSMHPKGGTKGKRKVSYKGWVGSNHYTEEEHYAAVSRYIDDSAGMNSWLRHGEVQDDDMDNDEADQNVRTMMDLIEIQPPAAFGNTFYRGLRSDVLKGLKPGDEFHDRAFVSTTEKMDVAKDFAGSDGVIVRVKVPKGSKVLNIDAVGATDPQRIEKENILQAGTRFRVVSVKAAGDSSPVDYVVEVIP